MAYPDVDFDSSPQYGPNTHYAKELRTWNTLKSQGGKRPDGFEEYPKMLYRASQRVNPASGEPFGPFICIDPRDDTFSAHNWKEVKNRSEEEAALVDGQGWRHSPKEALEFQKQLGDQIAFAAAERHAADRKLSEPARREAEIADATTADHLPEVTPEIRDRMANARAAKAAARAAKAAKKATEQPN